MSREEEPSFVIKDPIYVKESANTTSCCISSMTDGWWGWGDSHEFCLRPAYLYPHKTGFFLYDYQSCLEHARRWSKCGDVIRVVEISEMVLT